jgi:hypothetical protein
MFDNPAWAHYLIFRAGRLVGRQLSYPSLSDCQWLERAGIYATESRWPITSTGRRGRPQRKAALMEALAA